MATLTLTVSDELAQTIAALPEEDRATYLANVNAFATAQLQKSTFSTASNENEQAHKNEPTYHILDPSEDTAPFIEADGEALRQALADLDAGKRGRPVREAWADMAAKYGFKNQNL